LVPDSRLLEVCVKASKQTRKARRGCLGSDDDDDDDDDDDNQDSNKCPTLIFNNNTAGDEVAKRFCEDSLFPFFHEDLRRLADMVRRVVNFPFQGIEFRDVLGISQQPGGLALCTSLLQSHFTDDWAKVDAVACCETGGLIFASALAPQVGVPLALIRAAGKLPPPTLSVVKSASHISSSVSRDFVENKVEMGKNVISRGASVVVVDDVLATGKTLCAVLQLLNEAGIGAEDINVLVVAEFPVHRGRELLRRRGFGGVKIQSILVFGGA
jgi:adenine phosphoribosyltransferase